MREKEELWISEYVKKRSRRKGWQRVVSVMICIVVFCTTYALILPAITQERSTFCGVEAHTHTDACYQENLGELICPLEAAEAHAHTDSCWLPVHSHTEECYGAGSVLSCGMEEIAAHAHTEECFEKSSEPACGLEAAEGHTHEAACRSEVVKTLVCTLEESGEHTHKDACYVTEGGELICGLEETAGHSHTDACYPEVQSCPLEETDGHAHTDGCYTSGTVLTCTLGEREQPELGCGLEETEGHIHTKECYAAAETTEPVLICQQEVHTHTLICYSDPEADVETAEDWEKTLPKELSGSWAEDVIAIAESQMDYHESTANYIVLEDGETIRGYTRYGDWYGIPYGDWCAMFASFCLRYAGVENMPVHAVCQTWIELLSDEQYELYAPAGEYAPVPGDLVFFDMDGDGLSDHVGLVKTVTEATEEAAAQVTTIEGNFSNRVTSNTYDLTDARILGYGRLPVQLTEDEQAEVDHVISLIDAMPSADEIDAKIAEFEEAEDYEGEASWLTEVYQQVTQAYYYYDLLSDVQKAKVTNAEKLLELEYIWSATTLAYIADLPVYQINSYDDSTETATQTVLVHGGTVGEMTGGTMDFAWWTAVVIEEGSDGQLYVSAVYPAGTGLNKKEYKAETANGFVLLVFNSTPMTPDIGDPVRVGFSYHLNTGYTSGSFGTIQIGYPLKTVKDNTGKLDIVESADTLELIEVNLYDYDSSINTLYNGNTKYPGFQQDNGTTGTVALNTKYSYNFGNNITEDLAAGISNLTNAGGDINATASTYNGVNYGVANIPLEGTMRKTLLNGYPAMADDTSLDYLFSTSTYATQQNSANINGLFRYNPTTGAYTFNSRENHAQFDAATNTFTLYKQIISSNFMMYPFGNFLPFNDITKQSAQASTIDRSYLKEIALSAAYRYNQGAGDAYSTLSTKLDSFITLMDEKYGTDWDAYDAVNAYFSTSGLPASFSETSPTLPNGEPLMDYVYSIDYDEETDFYFGMEMKMTFFQPKDGLTGLTGTEPMEFYFTGDDDVWIYVDDVLFLDLSGIHRHVGGKIDFVNGKIYYYNLDTTTGDVAETPYKTVTFKEAFQAAYADGSEELTNALAGLNEKGTFKNYTTHSFNFYYMERGAGSGVCRMNFNFPLLRQNTIAIEKELADDSASIEALGNPDFKFQVLDVDDNGNKTEKSFFAKDNVDETGNQWAYSLYDVDGSVIQEVKVTAKNPDGTVKSMKVFNADGLLVREETEDDDGNVTVTDYPENGEVLTIDEDGIFTMKAGQKVEFVGIPESWGQYYVRELLDEVDAGQYGTISVSGVATDKKTVEIGGTSFQGVESPILDMGNGSSTFKFENKITTAKLAELSITKQLNAYTAPAAETTYKMHVELDGIPIPVETDYIVGGTTKTVTEAGIIEIAAGETATISNILSGTKVKIWENSASAEGYTVSYSQTGSNEWTTDGTSISGMLRTDAEVAVTITNSEKGATVTIPGTKSLTASDGAERTYTFRLTEVMDPTGTTVKEGGISDYETQAVVSGEAQSFRFAINYVQASLGDLPASFYYRITEDDHPDAMTNSTVYVVRVTVSESGDGIAAAVTGMWKDGVEITDSGDHSADFVNTLTGSLTLTKTVSGGTTNGKFGFSIVLEQGNSNLEVLPAEYPAIRNGVAETVTFTDGKLDLTLGADESLTILDIPIGAGWTITETDSGGFLASAKVTAGGETVSYDGTVTTGDIAVGDTVVAYTNTAVYELPETGGAGVISYTMAGLALTISGAGGLMYNSKRKRRKGGKNS